MVRWFTRCHSPSQVCARWCTMFIIVPCLFVFDCYMLYTWYTQMPIFYFMYVCMFISFRYSSKSTLLARVITPPSSSARCNRTIPIDIFRWPTSKSCRTIVYTLRQCIRVLWNPLSPVHILKWLKNHLSIRNCISNPLINSKFRGHDLGSLTDVRVMITNSKF